MQRLRPGIAVLASLAAAVSGLALAPFASSAAAASGFCAVGSTYSAGTTITWTGKGDGHSWSDAANWTPEVVPDSAQSTTYQTQYVCVGTGKGGKPASVSISGIATYYVAGVDVGEGSTLTVKPGGELFLGSNGGQPTVASSVDKHSGLVIDASTLGGNSPLTVHGALTWTGDIVKGHRLVATQTGGKTVIAAGGKMLVNGPKFGAADLTDGRVIDNSGSITLSGFGYIAMDNGTQLVDKAHSTITFKGLGGIYRGAKAGSTTAPSLLQEGSLVRDASGGSNVAVVGVPVSFGSSKPPISVLAGSIVLDRSSAPKSPVKRSGGYGVGSCQLVKVALCKQPVATPDAPQVAFLGTSNESGSPKVSKIAVSLISAPTKVHGHATLGDAISVTAPTKKTTHSSHLTFMYDASTSGLKSSIKPIVYRGTHAITLCKVHGLTAKNTSCVVSEKVAHGGAATKGDLVIVLITIQPDAHWVVAR